ncbi:Uncharacterized protein TPAR_05549 [Tolypocladium paradoxum]|uniref:Aminoglycoside phosphotransferase domain-containing protein n=1 Tax=Tolypocladium paradoxum TaxID=94208 RepID=A0A2S4KVN8_9HYPO|nr:Uncharacterized protein TPAR_05549 [Tolypocladium paradoxum]
MDPIQRFQRPPLTYDDALKTDSNIIHELQYDKATHKFYNDLWREKDTIAALVRHHLGLRERDACIVEPPKLWMRGAFNVCVPIWTGSDAASGRKLIMRCAMPHKLAEARYPGTVDEKMRCETATYVWMQERCPDIPIPQLYGFGFYNHRHVSLPSPPSPPSPSPVSQLLTCSCINWLSLVQFTHHTHRPWYIRIVHYFRHLLRDFLGYPTLLSHYVAHPSSLHFPSAYLLLEHVRSDTSRMLAVSFNQGREDSARRQNLFHGMARIMLSLARIPQPHIGSFRFHDDSTITLTNRPLVCTTMLLENDGTPRMMQKDDIYLSTESYVADMSAFHDQRLLSHPNAIFSESSCRGEMAIKMLIRGLAHHYIERQRRNGPFLLQMTDLHIGNIFVDDEWNITRLIDLEWMCALPAEMMEPPYWLTGRAIDGLKGEHLEEFKQVRDEFVGIFEEEERKGTAQHGISLTQIIRHTWDSGGVWFWYALTSINAMYSLFNQHMCPRFSSALLFRDEEVLSRFWAEGSAEIVKERLRAHGQYSDEVEKLFGRGQEKQEEIR